MGIFDGQTSILASSRCPAKGIRQIGLFKVDSGGKRRLLHCCLRSNDGGHARKERETMLLPQAPNKTVGWDSTREKNDGNNEILAVMIIIIIIIIIWV